jgi:hypothetical protein
MQEGMLHGKYVIEVCTVKLFAALTSSMYGWNCSISCLSINAVRDVAIVTFAIT